MKRANMRWLVSNRKENASKPTRMRNVVYNENVHILYGIIYTYTRICMQEAYEHFFLRFLRQQSHA